MNEINWEEIYHQQAPVLLGVCRRYVSDVHKAEDLMHDAFITAIQKQAGFNQTGTLEGWLRKITVNTVLLFLRKEKQLVMLMQTEMPDIPENEQETETDDPKNTILGAGFEKSDLLEALDLLPEHHKVVFNLYVFEDFSHKEIRTTLGISTGTSKSHLARARKKIQEILLKKAQAMKEKKKRAVLFIFPFFKEKEAYIDKLYENALTENKIQPQNMPDGWVVILKKSMPVQVKPTVPGIRSTVLGSSLFIVFVVLTVWLFLHQKEPGSQPTEHTSGMIPPTGLMPTEQQMGGTTAPQKMETVIQPPVSDPATPSSTVPSHSKPAIPVPPPVIINKKIIRKDTVYQIIDQHE